MEEFFNTLVMVNNSSDNQAIREWDFLHEWHTMDESEKCKKLSRYWGEEIHVFIKMKDPEFFKRVVRPMILDKSKLQIVDYLLLEDKDNCIGDFTLLNIEKRSMLELILFVVAFKDTERQKCESILNFCRYKLECS